MLFSPNSNKQQQWAFSGFYKESARQLTRFSPLPERAHYFDDPSSLLYDTRLELRLNFDHILDDPVNRARFPDPYRSYDNFQLQTPLTGAVNLAIKRVRRNYKTAIPQFYRRENGPGQLQLLLPLCLTRPDHADLALAVYRQGQVYVIVTNLPLDMAINNARLIARPDMEWLRP